MKVHNKKTFNAIFVFLHFNSNTFILFSKEKMNNQYAKFKRQLWNWFRKFCKTAALKSSIN